MNLTTTAMPLVYLCGLKCRLTFKPPWDSPEKNTGCDTRHNTTFISKNCLQLTYVSEIRKVVRMKRLAEALALD